MHIDLQKIRTTLCPEGRVLLIKSKQKIDHIFAEILSVENQIRLPYYWLKILEILLLLSQLDNSYVEPPQQFTEKVSRRTQQVYQYIIENPFTQKNISEIAEIYGVSESSMKRCFKSISGASLGTFMKRKRMELLRNYLGQSRHWVWVKLPVLQGMKIKESFLGHSNQYTKWLLSHIVWNTRDLNGLRLDLNSYRRIYDLVLS